MDEHLQPAVSVTGDVDLPPRGEVAIDYGRTSQIQRIVCSCGWEGNSVEALAPHLRAHGVTAVTVTPINYEGRGR